MRKIWQILEIIVIQITPKKIKLQRFFTQLQIAASFFKEHFVGKIMYYETEIESVELHFSPTNFGSSEYIVELLS